MAVLNVKGFPDAVYAKLKERAQREHRSLAQEVIHLLTAAVEPRRQLDWMAARGLGKEIWEGTDVDRYIDEERSSWD
ncbi:MAG: FitA-like ribbon-helix-helix domain-containing protein [Thermoanaerobaculia bacterium]